MKKKILTFLILILCSAYLPFSMCSERSSEDADAIAKALEELEAAQPAAGPTPPSEADIEAMAIAIGVSAETIRKQVQPQTGQPPAALSQTPAAFAQIQDPRQRLEQRIRTQIVTDIDQKSREEDIKFLINSIDADIDANLLNINNEKSIQDFFTRNMAALFTTPQGPDIPQQPVEKGEEEEAKKREFLDQAIFELLKRTNEKPVTITKRQAQEKAAESTEYTCPICYTEDAFKGIVFQCGSCGYIMCLQCAYSTLEANSKIKCPGCRKDLNVYENLNLVDKDPSEEIVIELE